MPYSDYCGGALPSVQTVQVRGDYSPSIVFYISLGRTFFKSSIVQSKMNYVTASCYVIGAW